MASERSGEGDPASLFELCKNGELEQVKALVTRESVNGRDLAGRRSTPLHFAAGEHSSVSWRLV